MGAGVGVKVCGCRCLWVCGCVGVAVGVWVCGCVCGHSSLAGHRSAANTLKSLESFCLWSDQKADVKFFVDHCLYYASVAPSPTRPLREALHSSKPNGLMHWDYIFLGTSESGDQYLLVVKDDASKLVSFFPAKEPSAAHVAHCLLQ